MHSAERACVNCGEAVHGRANSRHRGPDIAWFIHCHPCAALVADQMEPLDLLPDGSGADIYRCRNCGIHRVCRTGWRTRCHVCLDERSSGLALAAGERLLFRLPAEPALAQQVGRFAGLSGGEAVPVRAAAEFQAAIALGEELDRRRRDGWTDLAGDVHGLPWYGERQATSSHGTWGVHARCGSWQRVRDRSCPECPPEPEDRSFTALRDTPYLLYLVRHRGLLKFGVGGARRVRQHLLAGAELVEVVEGRHADVIAAEATLKRQKRHTAVPLRIWRTWRMPASFGAGTEVVRADVRIRLADVLTEGQDVTGRFARYGSAAKYCADPGLRSSPRR
ncbi:hypothetical protein [Micromonospora narathiwatensis]|uniref:Uncharacterized protein n=1 Tax=Micromonospora narathiwatensis TaxID=299146 RepID=A0A1A8ZL85_9ACTN|nr:hypothetical protein [Micromonospora narathiwatensis]SBT44585.1 hypothetical protein GA0070621_2105 [Micromonospora narathiwatensis]